MSSTGQAPAPAPQIVQMDIREFVDLLVRKLADEQIQPLRDVTNNLETNVTVLKNLLDATKGQVNEIKSRLDQFDVVPEPKTADWREHVKTVYLTLGSTGAFVLFLVEMHRWAKGN